MTLSPLKLVKAALPPEDYEALLDVAFEKRWDPEEHPRWPTGAPRSLGGQFLSMDQIAVILGAPDGGSRVNLGFLVKDAPHVEKVDVRKVPSKEDNRPLQQRGLRYGITLKAGRQRAQIYIDDPEPNRAGGTQGFQRKLDALREILSNLDEGQMPREALAGQEIFRLKVAGKHRQFREALAEEQGIPAGVDPDVFAAAQELGVVGAVEPFPQMGDPVTADGRLRVGDVVNVRGVPDVTILGMREDGVIIGNSPAGTHEFDPVDVNKIQASYKNRAHAKDHIRELQQAHVGRGNRFRAPDALGPPDADMLAIERQERQAFLWNKGKVRADELRVGDRGIMVFDPMSNEERPGEVVELLPGLGGPFIKFRFGNGQHAEAVFRDENEFRVAAVDPAPPRARDLKLSREARAQALGLELPDPGDGIELAAVDDVLDVAEALAEAQPQVEINNIYPGFNRKEVIVDAPEVGRAIDVLNAHPGWEAQARPNGEIAVKIYPAAPEPVLRMQVKALDVKPGDYMPPDFISPEWRKVAEVVLVGDDVQFYGENKRDLGITSRNNKIEVGRPAGIARGERTRQAHNILLNKLVAAPDGTRFRVQSGGARFAWYEKRGGQWYVRRGEEDEKGPFDASQVWDNLDRAGRVDDAIAALKGPELLNELNAAQDGWSIRIQGPDGFERWQKRGNIWHSDDVLGGQELSADDLRTRIAANFQHDQAIQQLRGRQQERNAPVPGAPQRARGASVRNDWKPGLDEAVADFSPQRATRRPGGGWNVYFNSEGTAVDAAQHLRDLGYDAEARPGGRVAVKSPPGGEPAQVGDVAAVPGLPDVQVRPPIAPEIPDEPNIARGGGRSARGQLEADARRIFRGAGISGFQFRKRPRGAGVILRLRKRDGESGIEHRKRLRAAVKSLEDSGVIGNYDLDYDAKGELIARLDVPAGAAAPAGRPFVPGPGGTTRERLGGRIIDVKRLGGGINDTRLGKLESTGEKVVLKIESGLHRMGGGRDTDKEIAAYDVVQAMREAGFDIETPEIWVNDGNIQGVRGKALVSTFVRGRTGGDRGAAGYHEMKILDFLIYNTDRHGGNYMTRDGDGHIIAIDNGLSFWPHGRERGNGAGFNKLPDLKPGDKERLQAMLEKRAELDAKLRRWLKTDELEPFWERLEQAARGGPDPNVVRDAQAKVDRRRARWQGAKDALDALERAKRKGGAEAVPAINDAIRAQEDRLAMRARQLKDAERELRQAKG